MGESIYLHHSNWMLLPAIYICPLSLSLSFSFSFWRFVSLSVVPGVAIMLSPTVALQVGIERERQLCVRVEPGVLVQPLHYRVCVARNLKEAHQVVIRHRQRHANVPVMPNTGILR